MDCHLIDDLYGKECCKAVITPVITPVITLVITEGDYREVANFKQDKHEMIICTYG